MNRLEAALQFASQGVPVLPVLPGSKTPACAHGVKDSTCDRATIEKWWAEADYNIGVACGAEAGLLVLDVDGPIGESSLHELCKPADLPNTPTVRTANGGWHYYFALPTGEKFKNHVGIRPGLDIRTDNGYVVAPPSALEDGKEYVWELDFDEAELAAIPDWLLAILKEDTPKANRPVSEDGIIPEGLRNSTLSQIGGALRRHGSSTDSILAALRKENENRCKPPLIDEEVVRIAESIASYDPKSDTFHLTDIGNAERLVAMYGSDIRYAYDWKKWLSWTGTVWTPDASGEIQRKAIDVVRRIYVAAGETTDDVQRREFAKHAKSSEAVWRQRAMVEIAQSMVPVLLRDLDTDPMLLTVGNGTVDLKTGELRESRQSDYIAKQADVVFEETARCPIFESFLSDIFAGDKALILFIQKSVGYSFTASVQEQCVFICYGSGSNGKSTLLGALQRMLGDYAAAMPSSAVLQKRNERVPNDVAGLRSIRYATLLEIEQGRRLDEPMIKAMTGGDVISARFLFGEFFDMVPTFKLWFGVNSKPRILGADHGIWRRVRLIPFTVQIPDEKQDKHLAEKLDAERSGILNWALEGCRLWQRDGLEPPAAVVMATAEYRGEEDTLSDFIEDAIEVSDRWETPSNQIYAAYKSWCEKNGEKYQSQRWLTLRLEERGYIRQRTKHGRIWLNIALSQAYVGASGDA